MNRSGDDHAAENGGFVANEGRKVAGIRAAVRTGVVSLSGPRAAISVVNRIVRAAADAPETADGVTVTVGLIHSVAVAVRVLGATRFKLDSVAHRVLLEYRIGLAGVVSGEQLVDV